MSARFVPLSCPSCGGDAVGRARDVAAFCRRCGTAFLTGPAAEALDLMSVDDPWHRQVVDERGLLLPGTTRVGPRRGFDLLLPFWVRGTLATPAFLSSRPLALAHLATSARPEWRERPSLGLARPGDALPFGARLGPESLLEIARLARLPDAGGAGITRLAAVPVRGSGARWLLPGIRTPLVPDDILEADALRCLPGA